MVTLNDYLFSGDTLLKILHQYSDDLKRSAIDTNNPIDLANCNFLKQISELPEHKRSAQIIPASEMNKGSAALTGR